jgi:hypothetical protein
VVDVPSWWEFLLLGLAAWRIFRLLAEDEILDRPRRWVLNLDPDWQEGEDPNDDYRFEWGTFLTCPYCAGFWISLLWWGAWMLWPHATVLVAVPLAINAVVIAAAKLDK